MIYSGRQELVQGCISASAPDARSRVAVAAPSAPCQVEAVQALAAACQEPLEEDNDPPLLPDVDGLS